MKLLYHQFGTKLNALECLVLATIFLLAPHLAGAQDGKHPRPEFIPGMDSISFTLRKDPDRERVGKGLLEKARQLRRAKLVRSIGKREGPVEEMFGKVADIEVTSDGKIYVLDSRYSEIREYDRGGVPQRIVGGPGQGPKEFKSPTDLALSGDTLFAVLDPQRVALKLFRRERNGIHHLRTVRHGMPRSHMCRLGNRLVLQAVRPSLSQDADSKEKALVERPLLHLYGLDGNLQKSFGHAYQSDDIALSLQLSGGPVECVEEENTVVTAMQGTSMLYGYEGSGSRAWVTRIHDYRPVLVQKQGRTTSFGAGGNRAEDVTRRITALPTGEVLIQVIHRTPTTMQGPKPWDHVATYLVAPATGQGVYVGRQLPLIMDAHGRRLYGAVSSPYPQLKVYEF